MPADIYSPPTKSINSSFLSSYLPTHKLPTIQLIKQYKPKDEWFMRKDQHGVHGIGHITRVFILQEILAQIVAAQEIQVNHEALRFAAATHDICRIDDDDDHEHGLRSAIWVGNYLSHLIPHPTIQIVQYLNTWHVPGDHKAPEMTKELAIFKDADGLDRVRTNDLDPKYLRHAVSVTHLHSIAIKLFQLSRKIEKENKDPYNAVLEAGSILGIVHS